MNYRLVTLHERESFTSDIVKTIDIDVVDPISFLIVQLEQTAASATMTAHPVASINQIEIIDGSKELYDLDGYEAEAYDFYHNHGKLRSNYNAYLNGNTHLRSIGVPFGRYPWDRELAFDPQRFRNPQLKIDLDIDGGGLSTSTVYITVYAGVFDERIPDLRGMLCAKEVKEWSLASAAHEYTDLPLDLPLRAIYLRGFVAGTEPNQVISNVKLSEDQGKRVPFDHGVQEIERALLERFGPVEEHFYFATGTSNKYVYCTPTTRVAAFIQPWATTAVTERTAVYDGDGGRLKTITNTAGANVNGFVRGWIPHCVYQIPFGMQEALDDLYEVSRLGNLKLDVTGAATATAYLFTEQFMSY